MRDTVASKFVHSSADQVVWVPAPASWDNVLCSWTRQFTLTVTSRCTNGYWQIGNSKESDPTDTSANVLADTLPTRRSTPYRCISQRVGQHVGRNTFLF